MVLVFCVTHAISSFTFTILVNRNHQHLIRQHHDAGARLQRFFSFIRLPMFIRIIGYLATCGPALTQFDPHICGGCDKERCRVLFVKR